MSVLPHNPNAHQDVDHREWKVDLFRHTETHGWQQQLPTEWNASSGTTKRNDKDRRAMLTVAPRKNCIVIPALRQKYSLNSHQQDSNNNTTGTATGKQGDRTSMIRRGDSILLTSHDQQRAMVIRFQSVQDCQDFSMAFLKINPPSKATALKTNTETSRQTQQHQQTQPKKDEVISYVVRLLHDPGFLQFVHKLEHHIGQSTDGAQMLRGLEVSDVANAAAAMTDA